VRARLPIITGVLLLAGLVLALALDPPGPAGDAGRREPSMPEATTTASNSRGASQDDTVISEDLPAGVRDLARALTGSDAPAVQAAARLRRLLRTDPSLRREVADLLLEGAATGDLRAALILVFGTLSGDDVDPLLLALLGTFADDPKTVRYALLALGADRGPDEDDDVFAMGDRPWGHAGPGGLGITVRRTVAGEALLEEIARHLDRPEPAVREAAAAALRHSVDAPRPREAFLAALARESTDEVATVLGEALAGWAGRTRDAAERTDVIASLLRRVPEAGLDGYRFRMENDLAEVPLGPVSRAVLRDLTAAPHPFGIRTFALNVLARGSRASGEQAGREARKLLERIVVDETDAAVRDRAARLLREVPPTSFTLTLLARTAREDAAWNVRHSAVETLATFGPRPEVLSALEAATADPDERVAAGARRSLSRLRSDDR
jgi:hypothetical protein